jgi:hypothetical protein
MKTLTTLIFSLIVLSFISCKKTGDYFAYTVDVTVRNQQGQNLLSAPALFTRDNIVIYHVLDGKAEIYNPNEKNGFQLINDTKTDIIRIDLNFDRKVPYPLTLVKFGNTKIDTIRAKFNYSASSTELVSVWYNGVAQSSKTFTIVK